MLTRARKTLAAGVSLVIMLQSASVLIVLWTRNQDAVASKREQTLQIDVAFIIHGSKNITSPERKETFKEALGWAKKITKAFGEIGVNKTRAGLILYAEEPKLMFNLTEKLDKGAVLGGLDEASSPPALGNKTFTGKALRLALETLVNQTRKEALKKFFVFADRPSDDDPVSPAEEMAAKDVDVYGLNGAVGAKDAYLHDFSLDSLYFMLREGPFKIQSKSLEANQNLVLNPDNPVSNQDNPVLNPGSNPVNLMTKQSQLSTNPAKPGLNRENAVLNSTNPTVNPRNGRLNQGNAVIPANQVPRPLIASNRLNFKPDHEISGRILTENKVKEEEDVSRIEYGKDASVVITENKMKNRNSVGRYSSTLDQSHPTTEFGTVIGGVRVNGQTKFDVVKPSNQSESEDSNLRSKLSNTAGTQHKRLNKWRKPGHKKESRYRH